jgi:hypothetical protein
MVPSTALVAGLSIIVAGLASCRKREPKPTRPTASAEASKSRPSPSRSTSTSTSTELVADDLVRGATFVNLDLARFPSLPAWKVPTRDVITVGPRGADHRSIGAALQAAPAGAVVVVAGGEYRERDEDCEHCGLVLRKPVTLLARPGAEVTVKPKGEAHTGLTVAASDVVVRGIDLKGFRTLGVVWDGGVRNTVLADMHVDGSNEGVATMATHLTGLLAFNLRITNAREIGFHCGEGPCRDWRLEHVVIDLSGGGAGSGADAFAIESGDNFLLVDVTATGATADGIDVKGKRVTLLGCLVHHVGRNGVKLWQGGDVVNTIVHHTGADAALVTEEGRIRVLHSVFGFHNHGGDTSYFATFGYDSRGVSRVEILNSIFFNASGGIWIDPQAEVSVAGSMFWGNDNGHVLEHGDHGIELSDGDAAFVKQGYGQGRIVDPELDATMKPKPGSPARNGGRKLQRAYPTRDRAGKPRIQGVAPDVGAFEVE